MTVITSDRMFVFWENNMAQNPRILKTFKCDVLQTGVWYLPLHDMWITSGVDCNLRTWDFSNLYAKDEKIEPTTVLQAHLKQITEVVELVSPRIVASSSLDGKIKLWEITEGQLLATLHDPNQSQRGIRGLTYSSDYGSNLLSFGFENHINVWCPEVSLTRAFIGKLEGHSSLIVACKFIPQSPNAISIDDKSNIRLWDIRTMSTIQVISSEK